MPKSEWLDRLRLRNLRAALFASAARVVVPEIEHRLGKMLDDVGAIEIDVFNQRTTFLAIEDDMLVFSRWTTPLNDHADRVRRPDRRVRNIGRDKEGFAFAHEMIDDAVAFSDANFNIAFKLVKIFFRVDFVEIVPGVWAFDHHHKKIAPIVEVAITDRRFEFFAVLFDPIFEINRRLNRRRGAFFRR